MGTGRVSQAYLEDRSVPRRSQELARSSEAQEVILLLLDPQRTALDYAMSVLSRKGDEDRREKRRSRVD